MKTRHITMDPRLVIICLIVATAHHVYAGPRSSAGNLKMLMRPAHEVITASEYMALVSAHNEEARQETNQYDYTKSLASSKPLSDDESFESRQNVIVTPKPLPKSTTSAPQSYLRSLCINKRGMFPHPMDCRKYLDCWDGRVLEKFCPNDLVFSDLPGGFCDYLEYVDCGNRPVLVQTPPSQPLPANPIP